MENKTKKKKNKKMKIKLKIRKKMTKKLKKKKTMKLPFIFIHPVGIIMHLFIVGILRMSWQK